MKEKEAQRAYRTLVSSFRQRQRPLTVNFRELIAAVGEQERATHLIHPYPAKLLRHIPAFFSRIPELSQAGDLILDPFCGSGTVLLEAVLAGRFALGADANPLARLISRVKTSRVSPTSIESASAEIAKRLARDRTKCSELPDVVNLAHWFYPHVTRQLQMLQRAIATVEPKELRAFFEVCFSHAVRRASLADPRISVPVRLKPDQYDREHPLYEPTLSRLRALKRQDVIGDFFSVVAANRDRFERFRKLRHTAAAAQVIGSDARKLTASLRSGQLLPNESVKLSITSPPYLGAQKYIRASGLSLNWLGLCASTGLRELEGRTVGREHFRSEEMALKPSVPRAARAHISRVTRSNPLRAHIAATYLDDMGQALHELYRVTKSAGHLVLIVGPNTLCGEPFDTPKYVLHLATELGFQLRLQLLDTIRSRGLMTRRNHSSGLIASESILVLQKP